MKALVLMLENRQVWHNQVRALLEEQGYEVHGAFLRQDAEQLVRENRFDIALVDVHLPGGLGFQVIPCLRVACPEVRVLVMSALPHYTAAASAFRAGANDFGLSSAETIARFLRGEPACPIERGAPSTLERAKREHIAGVLRLVNGNRTEAAKVLGLTRQGLQWILRKHAGSSG